MDLKSEQLGILQMDADSLLEHFRAVRARRRTFKHTKAKKEAKKKIAKTTSSLVAKLSLSELESLLAGAQKALV